MASASESLHIVVLYIATTTKKLLLYPVSRLKGLDFLDKILYNYSIGQEFIDEIQKIQTI